MLKYKVFYSKNSPQGKIRDIWGRNHRLLYEGGTSSLMGIIGKTFTQFTPKSLLASAPIFPTNTVGAPSQKTKSDCQKQSLKP